MEKRTLNRDIKRLLKLNDKVFSNPEPDSLVFTEELKTEFIRLYDSDPKFEYMNANSIRIMVRLNLRYRIIPFYNFGIHISIDNK